ncbi:hypothetical protein SAMN04488040_0688 [Sulfitobacter marinus]|uniref:Uncharacterized protein n=1 Tax=Sulfitobacter marinus TaxID=394264 RepID=A0A1I6QEN0_9RHOB|nr:hypothetical protein [Sulfitobacter marinus]SFS50894.1 hypothetical protein SAMN04488040_0688 [Sulfitobacter marinus]
MTKGDALDPKGLIYESYQIDGITKAECRTIFLDWALSLPLDAETGQTIRQMLERYDNAGDGHPMTDVMREGLQGMAAPQRRGGWKSRPRH